MYVWLFFFNFDPWFSFKVSIEIGILTVRKKWMTKLIWWSHSLLAGHSFRMPIAYFFGFVPVVSWSAISSLASFHELSWWRERSEHCNSESNSGILVHIPSSPHKAMVTSDLSWIFNDFSVYVQVKWVLPVYPRNSFRRRVLWIINSDYSTIFN